MLHTFFFSFLSWLYNQFRKFATMASYLFFFFFFFPRLKKKEKEKSLISFQGISKSCRNHSPLMLILRAKVFKTQSHCSIYHLHKLLKLYILKRLKRLKDFNLRKQIWPFYNCDQYNYYIIKDFPYAFSYMINMIIIDENHSSP